MKAFEACHEGSTLLRRCYLPGRDNSRGLWHLHNLS